MSGATIEPRRRLRARVGLCILWSLAGAGGAAGGQIGPLQPCVYCLPALETRLHCFQHLTSQSTAAERSQPPVSALPCEVAAWWLPRRAGVPLVACCRAWPAAQGAPTTPRRHRRCRHRRRSLPPLTPLPLSPFLQARPSLSTSPPSHVRRAVCGGPPPGAGAHSATPGVAAEGLGGPAQLAQGGSKLGGQGQPPRRAGVSCPPGSRCSGGGAHG